MELSTFGSGGQWGGGRERDVSEFPRKLEERNWERRGRDRTGRKEEVKTERAKQAKQDVGNPTKQEGKVRAAGERQEAEGMEKSRMDGEAKGRGRRGSQEEERRTWEKKPPPTRGT